uniref:PRANC domain-containing protein n=1 Tax=Trichogramma kaykai TaxID=54128 RepID=A0ABD2WPN2_9HYME
MKIYKVDVNYTDVIGLSHFHVAIQYDCYDDVVQFLEFGHDPNCLVLLTSDSPLHLALKHEHKKIVELLLRRGANPNLANKNGLTPLHTLCSRKDSNYELMQLFFQICDDIKQPVQVDTWDKSGNTPLHVALKLKHFKVVELLLKRGANANLANEEGSTHLHNICKRYDVETLKRFLVINEKLDRPVQLDVQDKKGNTPLHLALEENDCKVAVLLLEYGANPNFTNKDGRTPLHLICYYNLARAFLKVIDDMQQTIEVDARDKKGWTPLHVALAKGSNQITELLLERGADQNMADVDGLTLLHIICRRYEDDQVARKFFEINQKLERMVQVDALDSKGRTPLQYAVTSSLPNVVDVLLEHGADLSKFVFPIENDFEEIALIQLRTFDLDRAFRTLDVVQRLEKRGYVLDRIGALTIMKLFDKLELNHEPKDPDEYLGRQKEGFLESVKTLTINPTLSLYDLIRLPGEQASKRCTIADSLSLVSSRKFEQKNKEFRQECKKYLCEMIHEKFCRRWALEFFLSLTRYQLPILCCDIIIRRLTNEDLLNMCLAAENM